MHKRAMEIKIGGSSKKAGVSKLSKFVQKWDLHLCNGSYLIIFFAALVALWCFVYFDILHFTPSGGLLLNLSAIRSFSHVTSLTTRLHPSSNPSPSHHHHLHSSDVQGSSESVSHTTLSPSDPSPLSDNNPFLDSPQSTNPIADLPQLANPKTQSNSYPIEGLVPTSSSHTDSSFSRDQIISPSPDPSLLDGDGASAGGSKKEEETKTGEKKNGEKEAQSLTYERPKRKEGECNLYEGKWVRDEAYPLYRSEACPFIDEGFRCQENGRPDDDYLKWRWQPSGCNMPRFNSETMLEMLRGRRLVFVGDSIGRNQWESMLCILATGVKNKTRIYEVNGEPITKHKGFLIFRFEAYNCTIEYYRSPFLVPQGRPPRNAPTDVRSTLKVDTIDWTSNRWLGAHIIVFNTGHWWSYEKTIRGGCFFQVGGNVNKNMTVEDGFLRAMRTWRRWVASNVDTLKTHIFFRTYAPAHFSGGTWKSGGRCDTEKEPYEEGSEFGKEPWTNEAVVAQAAALLRSHMQAHLLDITFLSSFRKDAHSSIYHVRPTHVPRSLDRQDCSHWCLPGLPDTWNELLYASVLSSSKPSPL